MRTVYKLIVFAIAMLAYGSVMAQTVVRPGNPTTLNIQQGGNGADSMMKIPYRDTTALYPGYTKCGRVTIRPQDGALYVNDCSKWVKVGGTTPDSFASKRYVDSIVATIVSGTVDSNLYTTVTRLNDSLAYKEDKRDFVDKFNYVIQGDTLFTCDTTLTEIGNIIRANNMWLIAVTIVYPASGGSFIRVYGSSSGDPGTWSPITQCPRSGEDPYMFLEEDETITFYFEDGGDVPFRNIRGYSLSANLTTWTDLGDVIDIGSSGAWDGRDISSPIVKPYGDAPGRIMYFEGRGNTNQDGALGFATSPDKTTFTKSTLNPIAAGTQLWADTASFRWATTIVPDDLDTFNGRYYMTFHATTNALGYQTGVMFSYDGERWYDAKGGFINKDYYNNSDVMFWQKDGYTLPVFYAKGTKSVVVGNWGVGLDGEKGIWRERLTSPKSTYVIADSILMYNNDINRHLIFDPKRTSITTHHPTTIYGLKFGSGITNGYQMAVTPTYVVVGDTIGMAAGTKSLFVNGPIFAFGATTAEVSGFTGTYSSFVQKYRFLGTSTHTLDLRNNTNTNVFSILQSNANVGIGVSTPLERLHVVNNIRTDTKFIAGNPPTGANTDSFSVRNVATGEYRQFGRPIDYLRKADSTIYVTHTTLNDTAAALRSAIAGGGTAYTGHYPVDITGTNVSLETTYLDSVLNVGDTVGLLSTKYDIRALTGGTINRILGRWNSTGYVEEIAWQPPLILNSGALTVSNAAADGSTKGASAYTANDFNASSGVISLDYTNGQKATSSVPGFLSAADWQTFNDKLDWADTVAALATKYDIDTLAEYVYSIAPGSGTVTSVSATDGGGFDFTITNPTTTPNISLALQADNNLVTDAEKTVIGNTSGTNTGDQTITLTGDVTGTGTGSFAATIADAAVQINDIDATGTPSGTTFLRGDGTWSTPGGSGTVTSVDASVPAGFAISGNPVTSSGTLAITYATGQTANRFLATPDGTIGALSLRAIVANDIPTLNQNTTGSAASLTTTRTIWGQNFNGTANVTGDITLGSSNITMTGSIAATGSRVTKGWFTDIESTNPPTVGGTALPTATSTTTLTNKRITPRIGTTASSGTPTPDADANDIYTVTALAAGATFAAPTGTPTDGQQLLIRIKDNGTARSLGWNAIYRGGTDIALPTTTVISKTMYVQFIYNSADTKWDLVGLTDGLYIPWWLLVAFLPWRLRLWLRWRTKKWGAALLFLMLANTVFAQMPIVNGWRHAGGGGGTTVYRLYPDDTVPGLTPGFSSSWDVTTSANRRGISTAKATGMNVTKATAMIGTSGLPKSLLGRQFILVGGSGLAAQTISGDFKAQILASNSGPAGTNYPAIIGRVLSSDGTVERCVLFNTSTSATGTAVTSTTYTNRQYPAVTTMTPCACSAGDIVVLEVGGRSDNLGGSITFRNRYTGSNGTDLPEDNSTTTAQDTWFEFVSGIILQ